MPESSHLEDFGLQHHLRVRWNEVDMQGIVFFAQYYIYFDIAQAEYFRALGFSYQDMCLTPDYELFTRKTECEHLGSARFDDDLIIGARVARMGRSSLTMAFAACRADTLLARGEIVYVFAHPTRRESCPIPDTLRDAVIAFEPRRPEQ